MEITGSFRRRLEKELSFILIFLKGRTAMLYRSHRGGVYYTPENTMPAFLPILEQDENTDMMKKISSSNRAITKQATG